MFRTSLKSTMRPHDYESGDTKERYVITISYDKRVTRSDKYFEALTGDNEKKIRKLGLLSISKGVLRA
jgi:hypothetical protein